MDDNSVITNIESQELTNIETFLEYLREQDKRRKTPQSSLVVPLTTDSASDSYNVAGMIITIPPALLKENNEKTSVKAAALTIEYPRLIPLQLEQKQERQDCLSQCFKAIKKPKLTVTFSITSQEDLDQLRSFIDITQNAASGKPLIWVFNVRCDPGFQQEYEAIKAAAQSSQKMVQPPSPQNNPKALMKEIGVSAQTHTGVSAQTQTDDQINPETQQQAQQTQMLAMMQKGIEDLTTELQQEKNTTATRTSEIQRAQETHQEQLRKIAALEKEIATLKSAQQQSQQKKDNTKTIATETQTPPGSLRLDDVDQTVMEARSQIGQLNENIKQLTESLAKASTESEAQRQKIERFNMGYEDLAGQLAEKNTTLQETLESLRCAVTALEEMSVETEQKTEITQLQEENQKHLEEPQRSIEQLQEQVAELTHKTATREPVPTMSSELPTIVHSILSLLEQIDDSSMSQQLAPKNNGQKITLTEEVFSAMTEYWQQNEGFRRKILSSPRLQQRLADIFAFTQQQKKMINALIPKETGFLLMNARGSYAGRSQPNWGNLNVMHKYALGGDNFFNLDNRIGTPRQHDLVPKQWLLEDGIGSSNLPFWQYFNNMMVKDIRVRNMLVRWMLNREPGGNNTVPPWSPDKQKPPSYLYSLRNEDEPNKKNKTKKF